MGERENRRVRLQALMFFLSVLFNLAGMLPSYALLSRMEWDLRFLLIPGGAGLALGACLYILGRTVFDRNPVLWGAALFFLGVSKGACATAILRAIDREEFHLSEPVAWGCLIPLAAGLGAVLFLLALRRIPAVGRQPVAFFAPILLVLSVGAFLSIGFGGQVPALCFFASLTVFCSCVGWLVESESVWETRNNLGIASMFYAISLFLIALIVVCLASGDGDCGDCCDCSGCDCGGGGGKKKKK